MIFAKSIRALLAFLLLVIPTMNIYTQDAHTATFIWSNNLGDIYYPLSGNYDIAPESFEKKLRSLNKKYINAAWVDSGNFSGLLMYEEKNYDVTPLRLFKDMQYDAVNLGQNEIFFNRDVTTRWLPYIGSNRFVSYLHQSDNLAPLGNTFRSKITSLLNVAFLGMTDPSQDETLKDIDQIVAFPDKLNWLKELSERLKQMNDVVVLLSDCPLEKNRMIARECDVDLILQPGTSESTMSEVYKENGTFIVKPAAGTHLHKVEARVNFDGNVIDCTVSDIPLSRNKEKILYKETAKKNLPRIGTLVEDDRNVMKQIRKDFANLEIVRTSNPFEPEVSLGNEEIYFYKMLYREKEVARVYRLEHVIGENVFNLDALLCLNSRNGIECVHFLKPPTVMGYGTVIEKMIRNLIAPDESEIPNAKVNGSGSQTLKSIIYQDIRHVLKINRAFLEADI